MPPRNRFRYFLILGAFAALVVVLALFLIFPTQIKFPPCLFKRFVGLYCPGCGSTRAVRRLLAGDLLGSLRYNPLTAPFLPICAAMVVAYFRNSQRGVHPCNRRAVVFGWACLAIFVVFFVLRNIPLPALDILRPPAGPLP
ncbi:MAG: DUF2752 domain-containing protein [Thermoguttaceae bacterium]|nr:DUF2752 domain-containing protein [Thermoguttaceae bacterium]